jgi:hypothetical protein
MTTGRRSSPAAVSRYSAAPVRSLPRAEITPASSSSLSRFDNSVGDIFGTPRRKSLKRAGPVSSSRSSSAVHFEQTISAAMATGQNCP